MTSLRSASEVRLVLARCDDKNTWQHLTAISDPGMQSQLTLSGGLLSSISSPSCVAISTLLRSFDVHAVLAVPTWLAYSTVHASDSSQRCCCELVPGKTLHCSFYAAFASRPCRLASGLSKINLFWYFLLSDQYLCHFHPNLTIFDDDYLQDLA